MIAPLIISIAAALLCSGCIGFFLWQVGQLLAGDTSWAEASMPLILSQLGILFFAIFAMAFWRTYKDEMVESKAMAYMVFALFLEVAVLMGIKAGIDVHDRIVLLDEGVETQAVITGRHRSHAARHGSGSTPEYQFTTPDGQTIKGNISFQMTMSLPLGENFSISLSSHDVSYRIGSRVPVRYMPDEPERHVVLTFGELWCVPLGSAFLSLVLLGVTGYNVYRYRQRQRKPARRRRPARRR